MKLHFTTPTYNIIAMQGRVRAKESTFNARRDLVGVNRLARKYNVGEITNFFVANFVGGDKNGGMFTIGSEAVYREWIGRQERLGYTFKQEVTELFESVKTLNDIFSGASGHPPVLKAYLSSSLSIESLVILNKCLPFVRKLDTYLEHDVIWPEVRLLLTKYSPFVKIDRHKYSEMMQTLIDNHFPGTTT